MFARDHGSKLFDELAEGDSTSILLFFQHIADFAKEPYAVPAEIVAEVNLDDATQRLVVRGTTWNDFMMANQYVFMAEAADAAGFELGIANYPHQSDAEVVRHS